jgi:phenylalanyl-tRNA synthetase beta subunit
MTDKQKIDLITYMKTILKSSGWKEVKKNVFTIPFKHYDKNPTEEYRITFLKTRVNYEVRNLKDKKWIKLSSDLYKNIKTWDSGYSKWFSIQGAFFNDDFIK